MEVVHDLDVVDDDDDGWHAEQAVRDVRWSGWVLTKGLADEQIAR